MLYIIYDSTHGNTRLIAESILTGASRHIHAVIEPAGANLLHAPNAEDVYVIGSPTQGGRPTSAVQDMLDSIPSQVHKSIRFAAFDTRFDPKEQNIFLKFLMRSIGYAGNKIEKRLVERGATKITPMQAFIVNDTRGPLRDGEREKAEQWGETIGKMSLKNNGLS